MLGIHVPTKESFQSDAPRSKLVVAYFVYLPRLLEVPYLKLQPAHALRKPWAVASLVTSLLLLDFKVASPSRRVTGTLTCRWMLRVRDPQSRRDLLARRLDHLKL